MLTSLGRGKEFVGVFSVLLLVIGCGSVTATGDAGGDAALEAPAGGDASLEAAAGVGGGAGTTGAAGAAAGSSGAAGTGAHDAGTLDPYHACVQNIVAKGYERCAACRDAAGSVAAACRARIDAVATKAVIRRSDFDVSDVAGTCAADLVELACGPLPN